MNLFYEYKKISLIKRILLGFVLGAFSGLALSFLVDASITKSVTDWVAPFGDVFVKMLKMVVIPIIFTSLLIGSFQLPIAKFGNIGVKVFTWYILTSFLAAIVGVVIALAVNPGSHNQKGWAEKQQSSEIVQKSEQIAPAKENPFKKIFLSLFENPFKALSQSSFLAIIVFALLLGVGANIMTQNKNSDTNKIHLFIDFIDGFRITVFKILDFVMEYTPVGVFALSLVNFAIYGPKIIGVYLIVTLGVIGGVLIMMFVIYPLMLFLRFGKNPFHVIRKIRPAIVTAFTTRSSAATIPITLVTVQEKLKVKNELASFSVPIGATINMDGICIHLPMFAVLASNLFGVPLGFNELILIVVTTVFASIGAGGVPGGSLLLLFMILESIGLAQGQIAVIVAMSLAVNPILDMFETMNNVTGDMICTYTVAKSEDLIES